MRQSILRRNTIAVILVVGCLWSFFFIKSNYGKEERRRERVPSQHSNVCPVLHFSKTNLPMTALASFPGSGNTWLRHLIQQSTGIYTGCTYKDPAMLRKGFRGEGVANGSVIVIKTHISYRSKIKQPEYDRAILIVRTPYVAMISDFNRNKSPNRSHVGFASPKLFQSDVWKNYSKKAISYWTSFNLSWLRRFKGPVHVIFYDDLKADLGAEMDGVNRFLGVNPSFVRCALQNPQGKFLRIKKTTPDYNKLFDAEFMKMSKQKIREVYKAAYTADHVTMSLTGQSRASKF